MLYGRVKEEVGEEQRDGGRCRFLAYGRGKMEVYDV